MDGQRRRERILMVMDETDFYALRRMERKDSPFTLIPYRGLLGEMAVAAYLQEHGEEFDAVAVFDTPAYDGGLRAVRPLEVPKILIRGSDREVEGDFIYMPFPCRPAEFDEVVRRLQKPAAPQ